jgi:hypothetical protein
MASKYHVGELTLRRPSADFVGRSSTDDVTGHIARSALLETFSDLDQTDGIPAIEFRCTALGDTRYQIRVLHVEQGDSFRTLT